MIVNAAVFLPCTMPVVASTKDGGYADVFAQRRATWEGLMSDPILSLSLSPLFAILFIQYFLPRKNYKFI